MFEVQSMILNLSFPKTLEEVCEIVRKGSLFTINALISDCEKQTSDFWTAPNWIKPDDIVFFMYSKRSIHTIARLRNQLKRERDEYQGEEDEMTALLDHGLDLYRKYGGKIFVIGRVKDAPFYNDPEELDYMPHWSSRRYTEMDQYCLLKDPIDLSDFKPFINLSCGGSVTPVYGKEFERLRDMISARNPVPEYLDESVAMPIPLSRIDPSNWLEISSKYRRRFIYESQFRSYYVDFFLSVLGDKKTFYRECACKKADKRTCFIDNVILLNGRFLPVEVKLSIETEKNIDKQLAKYCNLDTLYLDKTENRIAPDAKVVKAHVLVIDTFAVYLYNDKDETITKLIDLDLINKREDILALREKVSEEIYK